MTNPRRKKALEAKLDTAQKKAVFLLVENELLPKKEQRTKEEIAHEVGVTYKTIWSWSKRNKDFIEFKNLVADEYLEENRNRVNAQLMKLIDAEQPSVKAIDLYYRRFGLLTERKQIEVDNGEGSRTNDDLARELAELDELLDGNE